MIVGKGDIASALTEALRPADEGFVFFASGVSNSQETREFEFDREVSLLMDQPKNKHLVYFSSLSIFYNKNRYTAHKLTMEALVKDRFSNYTIVRLGNITWGTNPNTLINFFRNELKENNPIKVQATTRYIIDKEEFIHWINLIPDWSCEMNITGQPMSIREIVKKYVL